MNRRQFLKACSALPFLGVAAAVPVEPFADQDVYYEFDPKTSDTYRPYDGSKVTIANQGLEAIGEKQIGLRHSNRRRIVV